MPRLNRRSSPAGCRLSSSRLHSLTWCPFSRWASFLSFQQASSVKWESASYTGGGSLYWWLNKLVFHCHYLIINPPPPSYSSPLNSLLIWPLTFFWNWPLKLFPELLSNLLPENMPSPASLNCPSQVFLPWSTPPCPGNRACDGNAWQ